MTSLDPTTEVIASSLSISDPTSAAEVVFPHSNTEGEMSSIRHEDSSYQEDGMMRAAPCRDTTGMMSASPSHGGGGSGSVTPSRSCSKVNRPYAPSLFANETELENLKHVIIHTGERRSSSCTPLAATPQQLPRQLSHPNSCSGSRPPRPPSIVHVGGAASVVMRVVDTPSPLVSLHGSVSAIPTLVGGETTQAGGSSPTDDPMAASHSHRSSQRTPVSASDVFFDDVVGLSPSLHYDGVLCKDHLDETNEVLVHRMSQRQKQIAIGKQQASYQVYAAVVPREEREPGNIHHPFTPRIDRDCTKRSFDDVLSKWRRSLHLWDAFTEASTGQGFRSGETDGCKTISEMIREAGERKRCAYQSPPPQPAAAAAAAAAVPGGGDSTVPRTFSTPPAYRPTTFTSASNCTPTRRGGGSGKNSNQTSPSQKLMLGNDSITACPALQLGATTSTGTPHDQHNYQNNSFVSPHAHHYLPQPYHLPTTPNNTSSSSTSNQNALQHTTRHNPYQPLGSP